MTSPIFYALLKEAAFTKEILGSGVTDIRKANYAKKGIYFQSFVNLSTGLERIGKLCFLLDYYIENKGNFPDFKELKHKVGHDLNKLHQNAEMIIKKRKFDINLPSTEIHQSVINILHNFAVGDRYSNLDYLTGGKRKADPILDWYKQVDEKIFEIRVSKKKKEKIIRYANMTHVLTNHFTFVNHFSEDNKHIDDVYDGSLRTGVFEAVAPYRQLYVLQLIRFWSLLIRKLQYLAMNLQKGDIPWFSELFAPFENDDSYLRTRKTWDSI